MYVQTVIWGFNEQGILLCKDILFLIPHREAGRVKGMSFPSSVSNYQVKLYDLAIADYVSPHVMRRQFVFSYVVCLSFCPSVCPSVCPSRVRVRSISFEPLYAFTNNFAQMSSMMKRCTVLMFDQGRFEVNVTI